MGHGLGLTCRIWALCALFRPFCKYSANDVQQRHDYSAAHLSL